MVDPSGLAASHPVRVRVLDGALELVAATDLALSGSAWSWTWSTLPLVDGRSYTLEVTATDALGNVTTTSLVVFVDRVAPSVTLTPSQNGACTAGVCTGAVVSGAATGFSFSANVVDGVGLAASHPVRVRVLDGATELVPPTDLSGAGSLWSWLWSSLPQVDGRTYVLELTAVDAAGNATTARLSVLVDRVGPSLSLTPSQSASCGATSCTGAVVTAANASFALTANSTDGSGLAPTGGLRVRVLDGASVTVPTTDLVATAGAWGFTWAAVPLVDGRFYSMEVTATDALGNTSTRTLVVLVDRLAPTLFVNSPLAGTLVGTAQVAVQASATDGHGLVGVEVATNAAGPWTAATLSTSGAWTAQVAVPTVDAVEQTLQVRATDLVGNVRSTTTRYTADRVAPVVTVSQVGADCSGPAGCVGAVANLAAPTLNFTGSVTDASAVSVRKIVVDAAMNGTPVTTTGSGAWSWSWVAPSAVNGAMYELRVSATDAAGNASPEVRRSVWVDTVAPTVTMPVNGQRLVSRTAAMATFSEPMVVESVSTTVTPTVSGALQSPDQRAFAFAANVLSAYTPYTVAVTAATDLARNPLVAGASASFLTEVMPFTFPATVAAWGGGSTNSTTRIAVDDDGRPTVSYVNKGNTLGASPTGLTTSFSGSQWTSAAISGLVSSLGATFGGFSSDLRVASSSVATDRRLQTTLDAVVNSWGAASTAHVARLTPATMGWSVAAPLAAVPSNTSTTFGAHRPSLEYVPWRQLVIGGTSTGVNRSVLLVNGTTSYIADRWTESSGVWGSSSLPSVAATLARSDGRAVVETTGVFTSGTVKVRVFDNGSGSIVGSWPMNSLAAASVASAQPAMKVANNFGGATATTPMFAAFATAGGQLSVACNAAFPDGGWQTTTLTMAARNEINGPLASAMSQSQFVVVGEFGGEVSVYTTPTTCAAAPQLRRIGVISQAREPSVTIDASGRVWVAWVSSQSSNVMLSVF